MDVRIRRATEHDAPRLGQIAVSGFASKVRFSFGKSPALCAAIFADLFRQGFLPLEHTYVATLDDQVAGFVTVRLERPSFPIRSFFRIFRHHLGFFGGIRAMASIPWLLQEPWEPTEEVFLEMMAVAEDCRSNGIGALLAKQLRACGTATGRQRITGYVVFENRAVEFYKRHGFIVTPPTFKLPWLANALYGFRGYHKLIWPLTDQPAQESMRTPA